MTRTRIRREEQDDKRRSGKTETKTGRISKQRLENLLDAVMNE
jgi:hypothetical protein